MENDLTVEIAFTVRKPDGRRKAKISVEYDDNDWGDVLALEKLIVPDIVGKLLQAGEVYAATNGYTEPQLQPA